MSVEFWMNAGAMLVGAVAAYFGAANAMRERIARLEARADAVQDSARAAFDRAFSHAVAAHSRIDAILDK